MSQSVEADSDALIPCPACGKSISLDAVTCPGCGHTNDWLHPLLRQVTAHLDTLDRDTEIAGTGNTMTLKAITTNARQSIGWLMIFGACIMVVIGLFSSFFMTLGIMFMTLGGLLIGFGLDGVVRHEITIDMRTTDKIVGKADSVFWADVIAILRDEKD